MKTCLCHSLITRRESEVKMSAQKGRDTFHLAQVKWKSVNGSVTALRGVCHCSPAVRGTHQLTSQQEIPDTSAFASAQSNNSPQASQSHINSRNPGKCSSLVSWEYEKSRLHGQDLHQRYESGSGNKLVEQSNNTRCSYPELYSN